VERDVASVAPTGGRTRTNKPRDNGAKPAPGHRVVTITTHIAASSLPTSPDDADRCTGDFCREGVRSDKGTRLAVQELEKQGLAREARNAPSVRDAGVLSLLCHLLVVANSDTHAHSGSRARAHRGAHLEAGIRSRPHRDRQANPDTRTHVDAHVDIQAKSYLDPTAHPYAHVTTDSYADGHPSTYEPTPPSQHHNGSWHLSSRSWMATLYGS
jgi:hypothetical protein